MIRKSKIPIKSTCGHEILNSFYRHEPGADSIVVLFPGGNYGCDKPLLYYAREVGLAEGCDVISLEYGYYKIGPYRTEYFQSTLEEIKKSIEITLLGNYKKIYFISKSLGTLFAGEITKIYRDYNIKNLYLAPLENTIAYFYLNPSMVIVGTKDPFYTKENIDLLKENPFVDMRTIVDADHSLEIENDYNGSLKALEKVVSLYEYFISKPELSIVD